MGKEVSAELDVLELLEANVERMVAGLKQADRPTAYIEGQLDYLTTLYERLGDVPKQVKPRDLLADVADDLGVSMEDGELEPAELDARDAGVLSMWSLSLGYVEGAANGVQAAMDAIGKAGEGQGFSVVSEGE